MQEESYMKDKNYAQTNAFKATQKSTEIVKKMNGEGSPDLVYSRLFKQKCSV